MRNLEGKEFWRIPLLLLLSFSATDLFGEDHPLVLGRGQGRFQVGELLAEDDFDNLDNWVVQIQDRPGDAPARVVARDNRLDCFLPGRGCTIWYKQKFPTRIAINYDVLCPTPGPETKGIVPRDLNQFWMASDPSGSEQGLFDSALYTGGFGSYHKIHCYYASSGGRNNRTTRMRRYPREADGKPVDHIALDDKDEQPGYMITPDQLMTVQLVAYDDLVQYIVNGKLVYEIAGGDQLPIEARNEQRKAETREAVYDLDRFPIHREGYFGFRMVSTHHIYTNFKVHALVPAP